jgi:hypothetical protein
MTILLAAFLLQDLEAWLSKVKKEDRESIEKELARFDAPEAADEAKFRPQEFDISSKLGPHPYATIVPVLLASIEKGNSPKRRFALATVASKMTVRGTITEAELASHNLAIVHGILPGLADADLRVRRWISQILLELADGDMLGDPPKTIAPGGKLREALSAGFAKLAGDRNPLVRANAELGASILRDNAVERLRVSAEVLHYIDHITREDASVPDMPIDESKKIRDGVRAAVEKLDGALVIIIACEPGKGTETPKQLTLFYRLEEGEWVPSIKDPRKKK